ncbi:hypothetical protein BDL97_08G012200 [Sphagnum fallax]|nr:hypothetical protein BDL97_08G012200 [Sphagnum fallax]
MPRECENGWDIYDHGPGIYRAANQQQQLAPQRELSIREPQLSQPACSDLDCLLRDMREEGLAKCYGTAAAAAASEPELPSGFNENMSIRSSSTDAAEVDEDLMAGAWLLHESQPMSVDMMAIPPCVASAALQQARNCNGLSATVLSRRSSSMYEELNSISSEKKQQRCKSCTESPSATSGSTSSIRSADVCCCMSHNNTNTCSRSSSSGHESTAAAAAAAAAESFNRYMQDQQGLESSTVTSGISLDTNMRAMLRKVMVNEGTLNQAIESCGGGTKGMKELMRRIMFWVQETYVESPEASAIVQGLEKLCMIKTRTAGSMGTPYEIENRSCCSTSCSRAADRLGKGLPPQFHQDLLQYQQYYGWQQQRDDHRAAAPLASTPAAFRSFTFADALDAAAVTNSLFAYTPAAAALHVGSRVVTTTKDAAAAAASTRAAHATARAACKSRMARQRGHNAGPMQLHPAAQHQATHNAMPGRSPPGPAAVCSPRAGSSWPSVPAMPHGTAAKTRTPPADIPAVVKRQQQVPESTDTLFFLLQKELRPSDVSNLGRIVLPKKEAETHLPWVAMREGLSIGMEDFDTGKMWTFRYRFWPNNKSRMYLLENIGGFVKMHYLQEGDLLILYRNIQGSSWEEESASD